MSEELRELFYKAENEFYLLENMSFQSTEFQELATRLLDDFLTLMEKVGQESIFPRNEVFSDIKDLDVKFVLVPYYFGELFTKKKFELSQAKERFQFIEQRKNQLQFFLKLCRQLELLEKNEKPIPANVNPYQKREMKIEFSRKRRKAEEGFEKIKANKEKMIERRDKHGATDDYGEYERKYYFHLIRFKALETIDNIPYIDEELKIIQFQMKLSDNELKKIRDDRINRISQPKKNQIFRIGEGGKVSNVELPNSSNNNNDLPGGVQDQFLEMMKEQKKNIFFKEEVRKDLFKRRNEPTVFLDEVAAFEMRNMREREEKQKKFDAQQKKEEFNEDNNDHVNAKMYKDREWNNWTDNNPKGTGNMGNNRY